MSELIFITPLNGPSIIGEITTTISAVEHFFKVEKAIICDKMHTPVGVGQFSVSFLAMPFDVFDESPKTVFVKFSSYFIIEPDSRLAKFYDETLKNWQIKRAGLVTPTEQDMKNVTLLPGSGGNGK